MTELYLCGWLYNKHLGEVIIIIRPFQKYVCQSYSWYVLQRKENCQNM